MDIGDIKWILIATCISLLTYFYLKLNRKFKYWKKRSVAHPKPLPLIGNLMPVIGLRCSTGDLYKEIYASFPNEKVVGLYELSKPVLIVRDPKLLEKMLVKDFQNFTDHGIFFINSVFSSGLFQLEGSRWRTIRYKMSTAFTSGKLKMMFNSMLDCTDGMIDLMKKNMHTDYEIQSALVNYTIDVIANTVFGIQINDVRAREEFSKRGTSIFNVSFGRFIQIFILTQLPKLGLLFGCKFISSETERYFVNVINRTIKQREETNNQRNDYVNHLVKLKEKGRIEVQTRDDDDSYLELDKQSPVENIEITEELLVGQAFQFLTAGFDPLFNAMMFVMLDMSIAPETQQRARQEIKEVLAKHGRYTYSAVKEMTYLEQCIQETLRLHPLVPFLMRVCTKDYNTEFGLMIEKGQKIVIPINAIHMDPKHYPNPEIYDPERQAPNTLRNNFVYLPFGDGPRICIGLRFAMVEIKLGLARIIENFKFTLSPKIKLPLEYNKFSFVILPTQRLLFNLSPA